MRTRSKGRLLAAALAAAVVGVSAGAASAAVGDVGVVARGLNNPRGVELGPDGAIYVAEAGRAGPTCLDPKKEQCLGMTAAIVKVVNGTVRRIVTGLPSGGGVDGSFTTGPDDVAVDARGGLTTAMTAIPECASPPGVPAGVAALLGHVVALVPGSAPTPVADVSAYECANDVDRTGERNSNPYAIAVLPDGRFRVADAGANAIYEVSGSRVVLVTTLPPNRGAQSVPTSIAIGPDGATYVGEFVGEGPKQRPRPARVFRIGDDGVPTVFRRGFRNVTGIAFGPDGSLFVTEWSSNPRSEEPSGDVVRVRPDGRRTRFGEGRLFFPAGAAVAPDGSVYVSNWSILPSRTPAKGPFRGAGGELVRIQTGPVPVPRG